MGQPTKKGSTDVSVVIRIIDDTDGKPEEAVEHNTTGISLWYRRERSAKVAITPVALAALTTAHSDGGIEHIDDGYYRLDVPDAAFASGQNGVQIGGAVTGMIVLGVYHPLVAYDSSDGVRLGLTALPNADADAAGGLPISDAGGLDLDVLASPLSANLTQFLGTTIVETTAGNIAANFDEFFDNDDAITTKVLNDVGGAGGGGGTPRVIGVGDLGDFQEDDLVHCEWNTIGADGASITRSTNGTIEIHRNNSQVITTGITDTEDANGDTGVHYCKIDLSADANYVGSSNYTVRLVGAVIDGVTVNATLATFSCENRAGGPVTGTVAANVTQILGTAITETTAGRVAGNFDTFFENGNQATSKTVDDVGTAVVSGEITANVTKILGTTIVETSAGNIAANFDNFFDNGDSLTSAVVDDVGTATVAANLTQILGTAITETTAGRIAGNVETFFENGDSATSRTVDDVGTAVVGGEISANLTKVLGTALSESTAGNIAANVETFFDNGDGLTTKTVDDVGTATVSGEVTANVTKFLGTTIVESTSGNIAANVETFFDNADGLTAKTVDDVGAASGEVSANLTKVLGTAISESTAGNIASNVETFFDNGDGLTAKTVDDVGTVSGDVTANVTKFLGTAIVETTAGNIAANFDEFFDNDDGLTSKTVNDVGAGSSANGANVVTITITDDAGTPVPLETATVRVTGAGVDETLTTDASGEAIFALDDATYTVTIAMGSYNGRVESLVVSGVTAQTWQLTPNSAATPAAPGLSTGTGIVYDNLMQPEGGVPVSFQMTSGPGTAGYILNREAFTVISEDGTGGTTLGEISSNKFLQGATYSKWRGAAAGTPAASEFAVRSGVSYESMVVPLASTFIIPETIGTDA